MKSSMMIIFSALFISFFGLLVARTNITTKYAAETIRAQQSLSSASRAATFRAAQGLQYDKEFSNLFYIFKNEDDRDAAVKEFFTVLAKNAGKETIGDVKLLKDHVPAVCMFDTDGFYLWYNAVVREKSGRRHLNEAVTSINTWSITTEYYSVRYFGGADDIVEVTLMDVPNTVTLIGGKIIGSGPDGGSMSSNNLFPPNGTSVKGNFKDVYKHFEEMQGTIYVESEDGTHRENINLHLDDLKKIFCEGDNPSKAVFEKNRNYTIITKTEVILQRFMNDYNVLMNGMVYEDEGDTYVNGYKNNRSKVYEFTLPQVDDDSWAQLIDNPGVIAFFQGDMLTNGTERLNIYSLYGYKVQDSKGYFAIDGYYHRKVPDGKDEKDGKWYPTKIDAAKAGNFPCPACNP